ncbi:SDR family oxidoreductase [Chloroflexi bacterium TSY]|nr:SDR family oxidoreductase [Chloroflexi bacterium TSY]
MRLRGKVVLITGGGTGVGRATAELFAAEGGQVIITGRREGKLEEVCRSIDSSPAVTHQVCDVSDRTQVIQCVEWIATQFGPVDIVVSNAGVNVPERRLDSLSAEDWRYIMDVNATGAYNVVEVVLPSMRERKDGVIISISSIAGIRASVLAGAAYSASKHAMTALSKVIGLEEGKNGIRATAIHPGEINTPILDDRPVAVSDERKAQILQSEDVAAAALFVATLPPRANIPELTIKPTIDSFS